MWQTHLHGCLPVNCLVRASIPKCRCCLSHTFIVRVNLQVLLEAEEETGSASLPGLVKKKKTLLSADLAVSCDSGQISEDQGGIPISMRGRVSFDLEAQTLDHDVHSGKGHSNHSHTLPVCSCVPSAMLPQHRGAGKLRLLPHVSQGVRSLLAVSPSKTVVSCTRNKTVYANSANGHFDMASLMGKLLHETLLAQQDSWEAQLRTRYTRWWTC